MFTVFGFLNVAKLTLESNLENWKFCTIYVYIMTSLILAAQSDQPVHMPYYKNKIVPSIIRHCFGAKHYFIKLI